MYVILRTVCLKNFEKIREFNKKKVSPSGFSLQFNVIRTGVYWSEASRPIYLV